MNDFFSPTPPVHPAAFRALNAWLIRLRWIATAVALSLILITVRGLHYLEAKTLGPLLVFVALLAISNLVYKHLNTRDTLLPFLGEIQVVMDLILLTLLLIYSGGIENPLSFVYLFHVILSGILFSRKKCYAAAGLSFLAYAVMALGDLYGLLPHFTLTIYPHAALSGPPIHTAHHALYVWSMLGIQFVVLILTAYFITAIMERLRREERQRREEHQRLERVLDVTGAGLIMLNTDLEPLWYNNPINTWLHLDAPQGARNLKRWLEALKTELETVLSQATIQVVERPHPAPDGTPRHFQITIAPLQNKTGQTYQVVTLVQDITEAKLLEAEMIHSAKMVTLGTMATGVAHEVGNPLASMATRLSLLTSDHTPAFFEESIYLLQREVKRIERIVRGISQFGRPTRESWQPQNINRLVQEAVDILQYHHSAQDHDIKLDLAPHLPEIVVVRDQMIQAVVNLLLNAFETESRTKRIRLVTGGGEPEVTFSITDDGPGIPPAHRDKMFDPFFTTKNRGSGLGLFIVKQIIQAHGGTIVFDSTQQGTCVTVTLPRRRRPHSERRYS